MALPTNPLTDSTNIPKKKCVSFATTMMIASIDRFNDEEVKQVWYEVKELNHFKREAREAAISYRKGLDGDFRGFENCTFIRQKQRFMSIRCTLSAFHKGLSPRDVAKVAQTLNSWANDVSFIQACHDYAAIYESSMTNSIPCVSSMQPPEFPFAVNIRPYSSSHKRHHMDKHHDDETGRRIRQRIC